MSLAGAPGSAVATSARGLEILEGANLVRPGDGGLGDEYRFKHSLVQETAYGMLLRERRLGLHREVARAIELLAPASATSLPAVLAYHYFHGGEDEPAFRFGVRAAEAARANYAYPEAISNYDLAIDAASRLDYPAVRRALRAAYLGKGKTLETSGDHLGARAVFRQMLDLGARKNDPVMEAEALNRLATLAVVTADPKVDVEASLARALELARQADAPLLTARTLWNQGLRERFTDPVRAESYFMQSLEITRSPACEGLPPAAGVVDIEAHVLIDLMVSYLSSGRRQEALQRGQEALAAFRSLDDQPMIADALSGLALLHHFGGDLEQALAEAGEAGAISRSIDNPWGQVYSGWIEMSVLDDRAQWEAALRRSDDLIRLAEQVPFLPFRAVIRGILSSIWLGLGDFQRALAYSKEMEESWGGQPQSGWGDWTRAVGTGILLAMGDIRTAAARVDWPVELPAGVIPTFQETYHTAPTYARLGLAIGEIGEGLRFTGQVLERLEAEHTDRYAGEMRYWQGRLHQAGGDLASAESDLRRSLQALAPAGARSLTWPVHAAMAEVLQALGRGEEAAEQRSYAAAILRSIAADLMEPEHRRSFLARPDVALALAAGPGASA